MKKIFYLVGFMGILALLFTGCKKDENRAILQPIENQTLTLTSSENTIVLDSSKMDSTATHFQWDEVNYNQDLAISYTLQFIKKDSSFEAAINKPVSGNNETAFSVADLNELAIVLGLTPGEMGEIDVRMEAKVAGLNSAPQQIPPVYSNRITLKVNPYEPDLKYPAPAHLYLVGDATPGGWDNPVPVPEQEFSKTNFYTFEITVQLTGGKEYLFIPVNGDWGHKYNVPDNSAPDVKTGTGFEPDAGDDNIKGPDATGLYTITVNFLTGRYKVTAAEGGSGNDSGNDDNEPGTLEAPDELYIVGGATVGGWDRPVAYPDQQEFTKVDDQVFETVLYLFPNEDYLLTPKNEAGDINEKYGVSDNTAADAQSQGELDNQSSAQNIPSPDEEGWYKMTVDFDAGTYTVSSTSAPTPPGDVPDHLFIVGSATPDGWSLPVTTDQEFDKTNAHTFELNVQLTAGGEYLLTSENTSGNIDPKYAVEDNTDPDAKTGTAFTVNTGENIPAPDNDGWYHITVDFATGTYAVNDGYNPSGPPNNLYIVGDATVGGWDTPVPDPEQKFEKVDDHTFQTIVYLYGGKEYLFMPQNVSGNIPHKYGVTDANDPDAKTGTGFVNDGGQNIPAPDEDGWYKITVDFDAETYTVEANSSQTDPADIPDELFILGDATNGDWDNPVDKEQQLTKENAYLFTITIDLAEDKAYKYILENGSWDTSIGVDDNASADPMHDIFSIGSNPDNIPSPDESGTYKIVLNFLDYTYTLTKQ